MDNFLFQAFLKGHGRVSGPRGEEVAMVKHVREEGT